MPIDIGPFLASQAAMSFSLLEMDTDELMVTLTSVLLKKHFSSTPLYEYRFSVSKPPVSNKTIIQIFFLIVGLLSIPISTGDISTC